jgi:hypothetical protein
MCNRKGTIPLLVIFIILLFKVSSSYALILPPDPFDSTDRFALLIPSSDGTITRVQAKVKAPGPEALGSGELRALFQYKLLSSPHRKAFHFAVSKAVSVHGLTNTTSTLIEFDFSGEPIPVGAYYRTVLIYYQEKPEGVPMLVSEYRPEQLLLKPSQDAVQTSFTTQGTAQWGSPIWGPITFLREREEPKTEQISFTVSDATGPFLLHLANGTPEGTNRVSSAVVKLNGKEIFRPSEFNQNVAELSHQVTLLSGKNLLEVRLRSAPGALITLELFRLDKQACHVLDIHTFTRGKGKPIAETLVFELKPQFSEPFTLYLTNGDSAGSHWVDSAIIRLNGQLVFDPNDFNERVRDLSHVVSVYANNTLSVELRGAPGDFLALEITGYDNIPPSVTIANPSNGVTFKASPITVSGIVDDPTSSLTVNGITTSIVSDGSFTLEGVTLQEGENIIKAVATDPCGNQGEDQIVVYLKTIPEGPELVLCAEPFRENIPGQLPPDCHDQDFARSTGVISGLTDETAASVTLNGVALPVGARISNQGVISSGMRDGNFFWAFVKIPQVDGTHPFTAVATNAEGGQTEATVTFVRDTIPPKLTVASPTDGLVTNNPEITITGTVDDPEATVLIDWWTQIPVEDGSFTTTYTLSKEGLKYLTIAARDPAGNASYVSLRVILDITPPQINITNPAEGMAVNTSTLNVTGSIVDPNIDRVTAEVNNGSPQPLNLTGINFSGTVTLNQGLNTLVLKATDKAGNTTRVTRSVILDVDFPAVNITSPESGVIVSGTINITVETNDTTSGISNVTLFVDGQSETTLNERPFYFIFDTSTLFITGSHTLTVRASDKAGNQSESSITVLVDRDIPIVTIKAPLSGAIVSGTITIAVEAINVMSGIASVTLSVDTQPLGILSQPPFDFSINTSLLASGPHTLIARAIDKSGNQADSTITVFVDRESPIVSITSPLSGARVSGTITVTAEASDTISGIASVTVLVDWQPLSTLNQPPFNFLVDTSTLSPTSHTLTARAIDKVGNQGEASITITVVGTVRIEITSPTNGTTINKSSTIVQGRIYDQTGEVGVVVNGVPAELQGSDFAVIVPLQVGQNTLTATATGADGAQGSTSIAINTVTQQEFIRLTATPMSGILDQTGILGVTFEAKAYLVNPISSYFWDFNGDGTPEITGMDSKIVGQYQYPGLYFPRVTVTDNQGNTFMETTIVNILSREEMDSLLRAKWEGMKGAMLSGDIEVALTYFVAGSRDRYRQVFTELGSIRISSIFSSISEVKLETLYGRVAECGAIRIETGGRYSYPVTFVKNQKGLWNILEF